MEIVKKRENVLALAAIVIAAIVLFGPPLARNEIFTFRDHTDYFAPMRLYTAMHLRAGRLPLWNPYNGSGEQWLANPQTGVFYPPAWLFLAFPFSRAFVLYLFVHALILGSGTYCLLRLRAGPAGAAIGSVGLMFSGPVLSLLDVQNNYTSFAWVPWILWCALRDRAGTRSSASATPKGGGDDESHGRAAARPYSDPERTAVPRLAAVLLALVFLGGEPFYAATAALLYCIVVRRPRTIAIAGLGAIGVAAVQLFPFVDLVVGSDRFGGFDPDDILRNSMHGRDWLRMFVPPQFVTPAPRQAQHFIFVVYGGVIVSLLAVAGAVVLLRQARSAAAGWLALLAGTMVVASGPSILARLPLTIFRYPSRVLPFAMLAIVVLAAVGWDRVRRRSAFVDAVLLVAIAADLLFAVRPLLATAPLNRRLLAYPPAIGRNAKIAQVYGENPLRAGSRVAWMAGYLNLYQLRFTASTPAPLSPQSYTRLYMRALTDLDLLREIGVMWLFVPWAMRPPFVEVARVENVLAYRVPGALPMAYVRTREGAIVPPRTLALDASQSRVAVATRSGGLLVLTQNDARGWSVKVDGRPADKKLVRGVFRAVEVPAGQHQITWIFRPLSLTAGAIVTALAMLWLALGVRAHRLS